MVKKLIIIFQYNLLLGCVYCLCITSDDKFLISGGEDGYIKMWDL